MKILNLEAMGLQEMNKNEMSKVNGGFLQYIAAAAACAYFVGKAIGYLTCR